MPFQVPNIVPRSSEWNRRLWDIPPDGGAEQLLEQARIKKLGCTLCLLSSLVSLTLCLALFMTGFRPWRSPPPCSFSFTFLLIHILRIFSTYSPRSPSQILATGSRSPLHSWSPLSTHYTFTINLLLLHSRHLSTKSQFNHFLISQNVPIKLLYTAQVNGVMPWVVLMPNTQINNMSSLC